MFESVLMVAEVVIAFLLLVVILLQRSDGGMGALAGGSSAAFGSSGGGNTLVRMTTILAILFVGISLTLAIQNGGKSRPQSVVEEAETVAPVAAAESIAQDIAAKASAAVEELKDMEAPSVPVTLPTSK